MGSRETSSGTPYHFEGRKKMKRIGRFHVLTDTVLQTCLSHVELAGLAIAGGPTRFSSVKRAGRPNK